MVSDTTITKHDANELGQQRGFFRNQKLFSYNKTIAISLRKPLSILYRLLPPFSSPFCSAWITIQLIASFCSYYSRFPRVPIL